MLYVFHVDTGTMMTFEMNLALESVGQLKDVIEKNCKIPVDKQVLLVSGGECLDPYAKVCSYSAGTDTNPIFLFSKCTLENANPPSPSIDYGSDSDMKELVDNSLVMPATYNTVLKRTQIAQQFCELAKEHTLVCENLVHAQHLQQQGWAAAVANLEDITAAFKTKSEIFEQNYRQYLENREQNLNMLQNFSSDLQVLAKIPILEPLIANALSFCTAEDRKEIEEREQKEKCTNDEEGETNDLSKDLKPITLLTWISTADNQSSLEQVAEKAQRSLEQFDEKVLIALNKEIEATVETADKCEMKEIKGLEERLFGLQQLMVETKKIVQEQTDLALALQQNQTRASSLNDPSILPDLCASHRKQLVVMLQNQHLLRDIRRRCSKAKEELSINLYHRLGWVMYVENLIADVSSKLMIYHENLKRLRKYLEITRQVQKSPQMYVSAVSEVVRRRTFSQAFLSWASDLSCRLLAIYNEECEKRKDFQSQFEGHFLQSLFPGLDDSPPPFATQAPAPFDISLPQLTVKDIEQLQVHLPEFPMSLSAVKLSSIAQMFLTRSITEGDSQNVKHNVEDRLMVAVSQIGLGSQLDKTLLQPVEYEEDGKKTSQNKEDKDFESETDTEEFEKVCQSPVEGKTSIEPKFENNSGSTKDEAESLKFHLSEAGKFVNETAIYLKTELVKMKSQSITDREGILQLVKDIQVRVSQLTQSYSEEVEAFHRKLEEVMESRESEIQTLKNALDEKEQRLKLFTEDMTEIKIILEDTGKAKEELNRNLATNQQLYEELKAELEAAVQEKAKIMESEKLLKAAAEEREKLNHDQEAKIEELKMALAQRECDVEAEKEKAKAVEEKLTEELCKKLDELKTELKKEADAEREKAVEEVTENLTSKYKSEIESLIIRFRFVSAANAEKAPIDSGMEKIEKLDIMKLMQHLKETADLEKERAVEEALKAKEEKLKSTMEEELNLVKARFQEERTTWLKKAVQKALKEKNNQVPMMPIWQKSITAECQKHKNTINVLSEGDQMRSSGSETLTTNGLLEKITILEMEKMILTNELDKIKGKHINETRHVGDMSASFAILPVTDVTNKDVGTSPDPEVQLDSVSGKTSKSPAPRHQGKISITSCKPGEAVLVVWNTEHNNYTILQECQTLYFVHPSCIDTLELQLDSDGSPKKFYCLAEVVDKEYCNAIKPQNRYGVPKGARFFRVRLKPLTRFKELTTTKSSHQEQQNQQEPQPTSDQSRPDDMTESRQTSDLNASIAYYSLESSFSTSEINRTNLNSEIQKGGGEGEDVNV